MAEYIDREAAIADLELYEKQVVKNEYALAIAGCRSHIRKIPAADVVERKRGQWIDESLDNFRKYKVTCPFCSAEYIGNYDAYDEPGDFNFCPNCGEDMREPPKEAHDDIS